MKTTYQKPKTEFIVVALSQLMAGSPVEDGFNQNETPTTEESSGNLSRSFSVWGDDED